MIDVKNLPDYKWKTGDLPLLQINIAIDELAEKYHIPLLTYDVEGLGETYGFICQTSSGLVVLAEQHLPLIKKEPATGSFLQCEFTEILQYGIEPLIKKVIHEMGLSKENILWQQPKATFETVKHIMQVHEQRRQQKLLDK